jgi:hypothetical protein
MPTQKRSLSSLEKGDTEPGDFPLKRLRTEDHHIGVYGEHSKTFDSPAQIDDGEFDDEDEKSIQKEDAPVLQDLYLETVPLLKIDRLKRR